jgi:hypothetical protein
VLLIKFKPPATKKSKIMPRSVNSVAKEQKKKNNEASQRFLW